MTHTFGIILTLRCAALSPRHSFTLTVEKKGYLLIILTMVFLP